MVGYPWARQDEKEGDSESSAPRSFPAVIPPAPASNLETDQPSLAFGDVVDELNGVAIYYNGAVSTTQGRHSASDGYNFGLRYQCVEFVKRYYYQQLGHRMPDTWGHAKSFYDPAIPHGQINPRRNLRQYQNGGSERPKVDDLLVFGPTQWNRYGHVAIVSRVTDHGVEIVQQNPGPHGASRISLALVDTEGNWKLGSDRILGWLRMKP